MIMFKTFTVTLCAFTLASVLACQKKVDDATAVATKNAASVPTLKKAAGVPQKALTPVQQKLLLVDEAAKEGAIAGVKKYRELFPGTLLAEGKYYIDLQKELRGEPSIEAVRKAVMNNNIEIARSEAKRYTRDDKKAHKLVDDFIKQLQPLVLEHAKNIYKRDKSSGFSIGHKLFPNTPVPELKHKLQ